MRVSGDMTMYTGSFTGNGGSYRKLTNWGFRPVSGFVKSTINKYKYWRNHVYGAKRISGSLLADRILRVHDDGITLGTNSDVNNAAESYWQYGFGIKTGELLGVKAKVGMYTGDGNDNRTIPVGFQPDFVYIRGDYNVDAVFKTDQHVGEATSYIHNLADSAANHIQSLTATGFQIGSDDDVNRNNEDFHWLALKKDADGAAKIISGDYYASYANSREFFVPLEIPVNWILIGAVGSSQPIVASDSMTMPLSLRWGGGSGTDTFSDAVLEFVQDGMWLGPNVVVQGASRDRYMFVGIQTDQ